MEDTKGASAPAATATPATPVQPAAAEAPTAAATPPATPPKGDSVEMPRAAFNERLQREREAGTKALLESLGVQDPAVLKGLLDEHKTREESKKTIEEKAAADRLALDTERQEKARLLKTVQGRVDVEMAGLTEVQRAAVVKLAGDDPAKRLDAIDALRPTWQSAEKPTGETPAATPPATPLASKDTAPPASAPADNGKPVVTDHAAEYERLAAKNPFAAALHGRVHARDVYVREK